MAIPAELQYAIQDAHRALANHEHGRLLLPYRKRIWAALGQRLIEGGRAQLGVGLRRRTKLAIRCGELVLNYWKREFPEDETPERLIIYAEQYLNGEMEFRWAWDQQNNFWSVVEDLMSEGKPFPAIYAGFAATKILATALYDEKFTPGKIEENLTEDNLDAESWDVSYWASLAYAGGSHWEKESSPTRRREFWQWYLNDAVPQAWNAVF